MSLNSLGGESGEDLGHAGATTVRLPAGLGTPWCFTIVVVFPIVIYYCLSEDIFIMQKHQCKYNVDRHYHNKREV